MKDPTEKVMKLETIYDLTLQRVAQTFQPKNSLRYAVKHGFLYADLTCPSRSYHWPPSDCRTLDQVVWDECWL